MKKMFLLLLILCISQVLVYSGEFDKSKDTELLGTTNWGQEFWLTFLPSYESAGVLWHQKIIITSKVKTKVKIIYGQGIIEKEIFTIPNEIVEFDLSPPMATPYSKSHNRPPEPDQIWQKAGIHIIADDPIVCFALTDNISGHQSEAFTILPVNNLGQEYIVASFSDISNNYDQWYPSYTSIIAAYDKTKVYFTLGGNDWTRTAGGMEPNETKNWNLNKGDVLSIASLGVLSDLSGSIIQSNKPVAVVSGNYATNIPTNGGYFGLLEEMELPTNSWGKTYHVTPIANRLKNSIIKIFSKEPKTNIYRDGILIGFIRTAGGVEGPGYLGMRADEGNPRPIVISGDKPINVTQYNTSLNDDGFRTAPFQMVLIPTEQYQKEITITTPPEFTKCDFHENYINICFESDTLGTIPDALEIGEYDKSKSDFVWKQLNNYSGMIGIPFASNDSLKQYAFTRYAIPNNGIYKIRSAKPLQAYLYGFSGCGSYGMPASVELKDLTVKDSFPPETDYDMDIYGRVNLPFGSKFVVDKPDNPMFRSNINSIELHNEYSYNYKLLYNDFVPCEEFSIPWGLEIIDYRKDAQAFLTFTDCSGNDTAFQIIYNAPDIKIVEENWDVGLVAIKQEVWKRFHIINYGLSTEKIFNLFLLQKDSLKIPQGFSILNDDKTDYFKFPYKLQAGDSLHFWVKFESAEEGKFWDSIGAQLCCIPIVSAAVKAETKTPILITYPWRFAPTTVGSMSYGQFELYNDGLVDLIITSVEGSFAYNKEGTWKIFRVFLFDELNVTKDSPLIIKPNKYLNGEIVFYPDEALEYLDSIVFTSNNSKLPNKHGLIENVLYLTGKGLIDTRILEINETNHAIFPNPARDYIIIKHSEFLEPLGSSTIGIYNALGECVKKHTPAPFERGIREGVRVDVSDLPVGIYFVRVGGCVDKFIKM